MIALLENLPVFLEYKPSHGFCRQGMLELGSFLLGPIVVLIGTNT